MGDFGGGDIGGGSGGSGGNIGGPVRPGGRPRWAREWSLTKQCRIKFRTTLASLAFRRRVRDERPEDLPARDVANHIGDDKADDHGNNEAGLRKRDGSEAS
jgi:hypothetical protein